MSSALIPDLPEHGSDLAPEAIYSKLPFDRFVLVRSSLAFGRKSALPISRINGTVRHLSDMIESNGVVSQQPRLFMA
jgi:hypothetical protein